LKERGIKGVRLINGFSNGALLKLLILIEYSIKIGRR